MSNPESVDPLWRSPTWDRAPIPGPPPTSARARPGNRSTSAHGRGRPSPARSLSSPSGACGAPSSGSSSAAVGALVLFIIGAIYGAPLGAIVGFTVGVPASIVLAGLLLVLDRPAFDAEQLASHVAGGLAALVELLATSVLAAITIAVATGGQRTDLPFVVAAMGAVLLLAAITAWLLRFAARDLVRTWARAWGLQVIR